VIYTTSVSPHAREHAKRHGAIIRDVADLGPIGIGPLDERVEPEPVDRDGANQVGALIYTSGTTGLPKGVDADTQKPVIPSGWVSKDTLVEPG